MKKTLLFVIPLLISLTACNGDPTSSSSSTSTSTSDSTGTYVPKITSPTTINFWSVTGDSIITALNTLIENFTKLEPNVTVNHVKQTGSYNDLRSLTINGFTSGTYPDMVVAYPDHVADYLYYNKAVDLEPYFTNADYGLTEEDKADYISSFMNEGNNYSVEGTYSVPWCKSTEAMFYNTSLIGLNLSTQDSSINGGKALSATYLDSLTWEELFNKLCPALEKYNEANDHKLYEDGGAIFGYDSDDNLFITLAEQYGYGYTSVNEATGKGSVDFDNDGMKDVMKLFHKAASQGYLLTKGTNGGDYINTSFTANKVLFSVGSTGGYSYQFADANPMDVGVATIPSPEGKSEKVILQGPSITVLNHDNENQKLASYLLWRSMTNEDGALRWGLASGYMGVRNSVYSSDAYQDASDVDGLTNGTIDILKARTMAYCGTDSVLDSTFTSPVFVGSSGCRDAVSALTTALLKKDTWDYDEATYSTYLNEQFATAKNAAVMGIK